MWVRPSLVTFHLIHDTFGFKSFKIFSLICTYTIWCLHLTLFSPLPSSSLLIPPFLSPPLNYSPFLFLSFLSCPLLVTYSSPLFVYHLLISSSSPFLTIITFRHQGELPPELGRVAFSNQRASCFIEACLQHRDKRPSATELLAEDFLKPNEVRIWIWIWIWYELIIGSVCRLNAVQRTWFQNPNYNSPTSDPRILTLTQPQPNVIYRSKQQLYVTKKISGIRCVLVFIFHATMFTNCKIFGNDAVFFLIRVINV